MLTIKDNYCRVLDTPEVRKTEAFKQFSLIGSEACNKLIKEENLEVRIYRSSRDPHCCIVKCSDGILWTISRSILVGVQKTKSKMSFANIGLK